MQLSSIKSNFQSTINTKETDLFILKNKLGTQVGICNYGARITHFIINNVDIVLGFDSLAEYLNCKERYHGVTVGPFANRIANGSFKLNNKQYHLDKNNGTNCLHGGSTGFHDKVWDLVEVDESSTTLKIVTAKDEGGFPGELSVSIKFSLTDSNELIMEYFAETKHDTVINLTNHAYFNLNGTGDILSHEIKIESDYFVPINEDCIPIGGFESVRNTPFDFKEFKTVSKDLFKNNEQLKIGNGYDHSFELIKTSNYSLAATAIGNSSKIKLEVYTTEPAVQFYTGNYLGGQDVGKNNNLYNDRVGFCFETQHHPDSPNQPQFATTVLKAGGRFYSKTAYKVIA